MKLKGCVTTINAHGRSQISSMIQNRNNPHQIVTIAHDGLIKIWNIDTMNLIASARLKCGYLTSLINYEQGFIVGTGKGELVKFNNLLQIEWTKKIHHDCVTDVLQTQSHLISIGFDGKVFFLIKPTLSIEKQIDLLVPLSKAMQIDNWLYVSGNPSSRINLQNFQVQTEIRSDQFMQYRSRTLSCSDQKGLSVLGIKQHPDYIPCSYMLHFHGKLITISQEMIGIIDFQRSQQGDEQISYMFYRTKHLKRGYTIRAGLAYGNSIILAGQDGQVYKFQFETEVINCYD